MSDTGRAPAEELEQRVRVLEGAVAALAAELARIRGGASHGVGESSGSVRPVSSPVAEASLSEAPIGEAPHPSPNLAPARPYPVTPPPDPSAWRTPRGKSANWLPANVDFESLIGRYGTLVLSTISALAAVGLFLSWAIEKGYLGPHQRLALGLLTAVGLGVAGMRLRRRERSFGASLLGLSLAVTHVCAWGAGPGLNLVPGWAAFLLAALASVALAVFAHAEQDEPLWCVGFSGAAIAPFVTASGRADLPMLAAYGVAVLSSAGYALNARRWLVAGRLFLLAALLYTGALATGFEKDFGPLLALALPLAVAILGVMPWTDGWSRRERLRALGVLAALAALRNGLGNAPPLDSTTVAALVATAGVVWLVLVDRTHAVSEPVPSAYRHLHEGDWLDAAVLPLAFALASLAALDASATRSGWAMAGAAAVLLVTVIRAPAGSLRDAAVFATVICALVADLLILRNHESAIIASIAALSVGCFAANRAWASGAWTTLGLVGLGWTMIASVMQLSDRPAYAYAPFGTVDTAVAAAILVATAAAAALAAMDARLSRWLRVAVLAWAFVWVHQEIAFAVSATVATLLRVTYYATTSVAAVFAGRARAIPALRHVGLALAVIAAGTALYGARGLASVGARIGAALVAAVFLLAIAYWYRRPGVAGAAGPVG